MNDYQTGLGARLELCVERAGGKPALAKACNMSRAQIFRYIGGETVIPVDRLLKVARAANVHPYWLLTGEGSADIPPIQSFLSDEQHLAVDAKSLSQCIELADQIDSDYSFRMTSSRKADFIFALYQGISSESKITGQARQFEPSKALEICGYLAGISGDMPRKMILNTAEIISKASREELPEKEIRTFCNYLNSAMQNLYAHHTLSKPYYDRIGYTLEEDTVKEVDSLVDYIKKQHLYRSEAIKILDLGCGNGRHLLHFAKDKRLKAVGLDNNELSQTICRNYENSGKIPKSSFVAGDMYQMPFQDESFDLVFANASLFHSPFFLNSPHGLNHVMQEILRVLRKGGHVYIHSRHGSGFEPFPFFQLHNEGSIRQLSQRNSFQVVWFKTFSWQDSIEYIPKVRFNEWFSTLLYKSA